MLRRGFFTRYRGQDLRGIIHRSEGRGDSFEYLLLSSLHPCAKEEVEEVRSFRAIRASGSS